MNIVTKHNLKKYELILHLTITFLLSWIIWGILYAFFKGISNKNINVKYIMSLSVSFLGIFMPSTVAVIVTGYFHGKKGIQELLKRLIKWKVNPIYYLFSLFYFVAIFYLSIFICNVTGSSYKVNIPSQVNAYTIILSFLFTILLGGPLGEELGWRGFVLPRLQNKLNPLLASLLLGIIWACWHIPLFFIPGTAQYGMPFTYFILHLISTSIILTWMYNRTKGSLLFSLLFHASNNLTMKVLFFFNTFFGKINKFTIVLITIHLIILLCSIFDMFRISSNKIINTKDYLIENDIKS